MRANKEERMSSTKRYYLNRNRARVSIILIFLVLVMSSCTGPVVQYRQDVSDYKPKAPGTPIDIYGQDDNIPRDCKILGVVSIGDSGFSTNCDLPDVLAIAKEKAREAGGDAIQITSLRKPDIISTCYRITANILKVGNATGTGFAISSNGLIVTAYHVIEDALEIKVKFSNGDWLPAHLFQQSRNTDIAILKIETKPPAILRLKSTKTLRVGDSVFTMGYPVVDLLGTDAKYTDGKISSLSGIKGEDSLLQITVLPGF